MNPAGPYLAVVREINSPVLSAVDVTIQSTWRSEGFFPAGSNKSWN